MARLALCELRIGLATFWFASRSGPVCFVVSRCGGTLTLTQCPVVAECLDILGAPANNLVLRGKRNSKHRWQQPVRTRSETVVPPVCLRCTIGLSACPRLRGRAHHEPRCL